MFKQILLLIEINQMASIIFHLIASLGQDMIVASTFGSFALLASLAEIVSFHTGALGLLAEGPVVRTSKMGGNIRRCVASTNAI
ncbi:unnamed protein product [Victoria cruziana]